MVCAAHQFTGKMSDEASKKGPSEDLVATGIGVDLRAVERHRAQLEHPYLARQCQHLHEQPFDLLEKAPPKRRDRVVIGMVVC